MLKKSLKIISFFLVFVLLFSGANYVLNFKYLDSTYKLESFYELEDNTVDVLALGSSHVYQGFNTAVLWEEYGYAAFDLCGAAQPIWNTYFYLEEALKTQTPKAIILDTYMLYISEEYDDSSNAIKNTHALKWSQTKVDAINASFNAEESGNQYFFSWLQYHSRYSDLSQNDFYPYQGNEAMYKNHKGFYCYFKTANVQNKDYTNESECSTLPEKGETYYRMIIELAQSKNIPIIITAIPFNADSFNIKYINEAARIAEEYGVPFYNFLREYKTELGLDYSKDFADSQHLNHLGNTKLTRFFGDLLKKEYNITDRRGDAKYASWDADAEVYRKQLENSEVKSINNFGAYLPVFDNDRYTIIITVSCEDFDSLSENSKAATVLLFELLKIPADEYKNGGMWLLENGEVVSYKDFSNRDYSTSVRLSKSATAHIKTEAIQIADEQNEEEEPIIYTKYVKKTYVNKNDHTKVAEGINICVYDTFTESTVDAVGFDYNDGKFVR